MPSFYRPSGNGCAERVQILGITFIRIATTNKPGAINPSIFCLFGFIFPKELLLWLVHHMYTGLSNGGRIIDGRMMVRSVPYIVRRTPHPELGPTCEFRLCHSFTASRRRPASTLTSAPGHISFITHFAKIIFYATIFLIIIITIISGLHYFLCTGK